MTNQVWDEINACIGRMRAMGCNTKRLDDLVDAKDTEGVLYEAENQVYELYPEEADEELIRIRELIYHG